MPKTIDNEALESPDMKMLDINNPPTKNIAHEEFPKMVYLHPKDKTMEHKHRVVNSPAELDEAKKKGWQTKPHIPKDKPEDLSGFEHVEEEDDQTDGNGAAELEGMKRDDLLRYAQQKSIKVDTTAKKEDILQSIKDTEAGKK